MVITFPNMGNVAQAAAALCQGLEIPYIIPENNNKTTLQTGAYYSPEEICLPYKLVLGNLIQGIKKGADTILMAGSCGPCRFGEYCELQMKILRKMGYENLNFIVADLSSEIGIGEFMHRIGIISRASPLSAIDKIKAARKAYRVLELCDKLDAAAYSLAGYEVRPGECRQLLYEYKTKARQCNNPDELIRLLLHYRKRFEAVETDPEKDPLKISIIGEIFTIIDPFSNLHLEEKLMDYGVSTERMMTPSWWLKDLVLKPLKLNSLSIRKASKEYLPYPVGGHCKECIGEAVLSKIHGMDGAIQILPLGCMPEIIAKAILPVIQRNKDFPILTLIVDEVAGEAGYVTRVEAFLDILQSRKRRSEAHEGKPRVSSAVQAET